MTKNKNYRQAVFVVVFMKKNNKIEYLILKRKFHWKGWEFPKGGINQKEKITDAVKREVNEETGQSPMRIINHRFHGKYKYKKGWPGHPGYTGQTFNLFSAEIKNKKVIIDKTEHSGYKWVDFKTAYKKLDFPEKKKSLKKVNEWLKK